ncbi:MAG: hypothetical protein U0Q18_01185 [Bryobacteraceae bacterium]
MKRAWNGLIWAGFAVTLIAFVSYIPVFVRFPATRDFPWVNLLLFAIGGLLIGVGIHRAFRRPERYRGKVAGVMFAFLAIALFGLFYWGMFLFVRQLPSANAAPRAGQPAPDFSLRDSDGHVVTLSSLRTANRGVLLVFYRGYW